MVSCYYLVLALVQLAGLIRGHKGSCKITVVVLQSDGCGVTE
jgi:hypothetical protein